MMAKSLFYGFLAVFLMLGFYFGVVGIFSGWKFAQIQFADFRWYILALSFGFGIQVGLYVYLRQLVQEASIKSMAATGAVSGVAMVSCCLHHLADVFPVLATTGAISFVGQYQIEFFWVGIVSNLAGILFITGKIIKFKKYEKN